MLRMIRNRLSTHDKAADSVTSVACTTWQYGYICQRFERSTKNSTCLGSIAWINIKQKIRKLAGVDLAY